MTKADWLTKAKALCTDLAADGTNPAGKALAGRYDGLRDVLFNDHHHTPDTTASNRLLATVQEWIDAVKKGTYDKRFSG